MSNLKQGVDLQQEQFQQIKDASYTIKQIANSIQYQIYTVAISNNFNYIIAGGSNKILKIWDYQTYKLSHRKLNAHNLSKYISQVLFIINNDQLISLDINENLILWNINFKEGQLQKLQQIVVCGINISLVEEQQYIISTGKKYIRVYSVQGAFIRQFDHEIDVIYEINSIQIDSIRAIFIQGKNQLCICKVKIDCMDFNQHENL